MEKEYLGTIYAGVSDRFFKDPLPIARTVKAEKHDLAVVEMAVEEKRLGSIYGFEGGNYAGNVYETESLAQTIRTYLGGKRQPMVICLNTKDDNGKQHPQQDRECDTGGVMTEITAEHGGRFNIMEKQICRMVGRSPDNPSDRTAGIPTEQRLEPNSQGICNTITTVGKDNMVLEKSVQLGYIDHGTGQHQSNTVYDTNAICPNITTVNGGGTQQIKILDDICINNRGFVGKEPQVSVVYAPTLRAEAHGNLPNVVETVRIGQAIKQGYIECERGGVADLSYPDSKSRRGRVQGGGQISPTITSSSSGIHGVESEYRIRKLTPIEVFRLMGFSDEDFHKAESVNSATQLYKQCGNSICRPVLCAIFSQLNIQGIKPWNDMSLEEREKIINTGKGENK